MADSDIASSLQFTLTAHTSIFPNLVLEHCIFASYTYSKDDADYSLHIQHIMNSPHKKRPITTQKWGGGIPHLAPSIIHTTLPTTHPL